MTTYKLTYFNITGSAEPIRYLLNFGEIKFEDQRISHEEWTSLKPKMPMGQVPVLEIDGKQYNQSKSIVRFLAKKLNLYGCDDYEALEIDAAADNVDDLRQVVSSYYWERDAVHKDKLRGGTFEKMDFLLDKFDDIVKKNGGYFVRGKLSYADISYAALSDYISHILGYNPNKNHAELNKLVDNIKSISSIKSYLEKRPKTNI